LALHNEKKVKIRRNQVASLLSKSFNETEIAQQLGVCQGTISRDIQYLKLEAEKFVFDLAKSDLAYYFKSSINGVEETAKEGWKIFLDSNTSTRDKLLALKIILTADETRFRLLSEGPSILAIKSLEERLNRIESMGKNQIHR
jgi:Trp operon repressor